MKYVFSLDLKVDLFKMSNASLVEDEIDDHSTGKWTKRQYLYEFVFGVTFCLKMRDSCLVLTHHLPKYKRLALIKQEQANETER